MKSGLVRLLCVCILGLAFVRGMTELSNFMANKVQRDYDIFCVERDAMNKAMLQDMKREGIKN